MKELLSKEQTRATLRHACSIVLLLICLQYLFAFFWAEHRQHTSIIGTFHPFTWSPEHNFSDITDYKAKFGVLQSPSLSDTWPVWNYPPTAAALYYLLLSTPSPALSVIAITISGTLTLVIYFCVLLQRLVLPTNVRRAAVGTTILTVVLSYPFQYVYWRGNIEGIAFIFVAWGLIAFCRKKHWTAACLWALGMCLKPYSALYLILLIRRRKFRPAVFALSLCAFLQLPASHVLAPRLPEAYAILHKGVDLYARMYVHYFRLNEARFQHSLLDSLKATWALFGHPQALTDPGGGAQKILFRAYLFLSTIIAASTAIVFWRKPTINQCLATICIPLILAPVSADYTTIAMHLCWALIMFWLLNDVIGGSLQVSRRSLLGLFTPFVILFAPQNWLSYYTGILHTLTLFGFLAISATICMPSSVFNETPLPGE